MTIILCHSKFVRTFYLIISIEYAEKWRNHLHLFRQFSLKSECIYKIRWVNFRFVKLFMSCMCFICFKFYLLCTKLESVRHCLWGQQHHNIISFSRNLETVCCIAWHLHRSSNTKISKSVWVSIWGQIHIHIDEKQTLSQHRGVWDGH